MFYKYRYYDEEDVQENTNSTSYTRMKVYNCNDLGDSGQIAGYSKKCCCRSAASLPLAEAKPTTLIKDIRWLECEPKFII